MRVTINDIAKECGVSIATVSLALSGNSSRVSDNTRLKIMEVAKRLNYTPNRAAVSLATNHSKLIGVIISDLRNTHISSKFMAIDRELQKYGYNILCYIFEDKRTDIQKMINSLLSNGVEGIIYEKPALINTAKEYVQLSAFLNSAGIPVMCSDDHGLQCPGTNVCFNFEKGGYLATKHLIECGHTSIGCVCGPADFIVTILRLQGYKNALRDAEIEFDNKLLYYGDYTLNSGRKALSYLLGQSASAIFSFNDEMAFGLYQSARQYGLKIPDDLSIIGFDNVPFSDVLEVPLSTINVPSVEMGKVTARELINIIENRSSDERKTIMYEPDLILRGSIKRQ